MLTRRNLSAHPHYWNRQYEYSWFSHLHHLLRQDLMNVDVIYIIYSLHHFAFIFVRYTRFRSDPCRKEERRFHLICISTHIFHHFRPGSNKRHISQKHIDQLRKFIDPASADDSSHTGQTTVMALCDLAAHLLGILYHGTEFQDLKFPAVLSHTFLLKEHRAR